MGSGVDTGDSQGVLQLTNALHIASAARCYAPVRARVCACVNKSLPSALHSGSGVDTGGSQCILHLTNALHIASAAVLHRGAVATLLEDGFSASDLLLDANALELCFVLGQEVNLLQATRVRKKVFLSENNKTKNKQTHTYERVQQFSFPFMCSPMRESMKWFVHTSADPPFFCSFIFNL